MILLITRLGIVLSSILVLTSWARAQPVGQPRWFTPAEIEIAYSYQEAFGERIYRPLKTQECFHGKSEIAAVSQGREFAVPCRFVLETKRHLKEMLQSGTARYLFPLDVSHGRLAVPAKVWEEKFRDLSGDKILPALLRESSVAALYYTASGIAPVGKTAGKANTSAKLWQRRLVIGPYDGKPITVLMSGTNAAKLVDPANYHAAAHFNFLAHRLGETVFSVRGKEVSFDISFDDVRGALHNSANGLVSW